MYALFEIAENADDNNNKERESKVTLKATSSSGDQFSSSITIMPSLSIPGTMISKLAGRRYIRELEEEYNAIGNTNQQRKKELENQITAAGLNYGLASKFTSFVAVEKRKESISGDNSGTMQSRNIPIQLAKGYPTTPSTTG